MKRLIQMLFTGLVGILICGSLLNILQSTTNYGFIQGKDMFWDNPDYDLSHINKIHLIRDIFIFILVVFLIFGYFIEDIFVKCQKKKPSSKAKEKRKDIPD